MTEEQKETLIAKMLEAHSSLSDMELEMIQNDAELKDLYEVSSALSGANKCSVEIDINKEWELFRPRIQRKPSMMRWIMRVAAIFLGVVFFSGIAVRLIDQSLNSDNIKVISEIEQSSNTGIPYNTNSINRDSNENENRKNEIERRKRIRNNPFIMPRQYLAKSKKHSNDTKSLVNEIDIDEYLRIQQARIDNELALQAAAIYEEEYNELLYLLDIIGEDEPDIDNVIGGLIME